LDLDWLNSIQLKHIYLLKKIEANNELVKEEKNYYAEDELALWRA
jgi:hypothetical protein